MSLQTRMETVEMTEEELKAKNAAMPIAEPVLSGFDPELCIIPRGTRTAPNKHKKKNSGVTPPPLMMTNPGRTFANDDNSQGGDPPFFFGTGGGYNQPDQGMMAPGPQMGPMDPFMNYGYPHPSGPMMPPIGMFGHPRFMMHRGGPMGYQQPKLSRDDEHVMDRHQRIQPDEEIMSRIMRLAEAAEYCLRKVSDREDVGLGKNKLLGVSRVGYLGKGLMLNGHREANLVLVCKNAPTEELLAQVRSMLEQEIENARAEAKEVKAKMIGEEAAEEEDQGEKFIVEEIQCGIRIVSVDESDVRLHVDIALTSPALRKNSSKKEDNGKDDEGGDAEGQDEKEEANGNNDENMKQQEEEAEEEGQRLDAEICLTALAEMRRSKFFNCAARNVPSCSECTRLLLDLSVRDEEWSLMTPWMMEVLCERVLGSNSDPASLTPSRAFRRIFEAVSSGIIMQGIKDPCEREDVDVFESLAEQAREILTSSAQGYLRQIALGHIHKVLGMEKLPMMNKRKFGHGNNKKDQQDNNKGNSKEVDMDIDSEQQDSKKVKTVETDQ